MTIKYGDLIEFEPIESVIQIQNADALDEAKKISCNLRYFRRNGGTFGNCGFS